MRAYSMDLRMRVLADADAGMKTRPLAAKYAVSEAWVRRIKQRRAATGETAPRPCRNRRVPFHERHGEPIRTAVAERPGRTLVELRRHLGVRVHLATLWKALRTLGLSWKKSPSGRPSSTAPMSPPGGPSGGGSNRRSTPTGSFSSTRPGPRPR